MANTFLRKFSSNIGNTATSIGSYTVGSNTGAVVIGLTVSNTTNGELNANVALYNGISSYYLAKRVPIPSEGSLVAAGGEQKLVLQTGDSIQIQTESGYGLDAIMTIMETSSIGPTIDPVTYSISANVSSVNEGNTVGFTVSTSNVPDSTILYWTTLGNVSSADFSDSVTSGNVTVTGGSATITRTLVADATTEGVEYFTISGAGVFSQPITINDTSTTPVAAYSITANSTPWNENSTRVCSVSVQNAAGTTLALVSDNASVTSQVATIYINSNNYSALTYWTVGNVAADVTVNMALKVNGTGTTGGYNGALVATTSALVRNIIPAGTPYAQMLPFKREDWQSEVDDKISDKEMLLKNNINSQKYRVPDGGVYQKEVWTRRVYE